MICRRVCKCEPLLRFNPLNLAKIVCFAKWVKGAKCVSSDFLNETVLMILTCIILKIKAQLNQLVNWKLWVILFYREQSVEFWQNLHISRHLRSSYGAERKFVKKISRSEFLQSSFIFVIYLLKEIYRKNMSEIHFVGKTRYEDLTETGS